MNQKNTINVVSEPYLKRPPTHVVDVSPNLDMQKQELMQEEEPISHLAEKKSKKKKDAKEKSKNKEKATKEKKEKSNEKTKKRKRPTEILEKQRTTIDKQTLQRLMRYSDNHANDPRVVDLVLYIIEVVKEELLKAMKKQTNLLKQNMKKKTKKLGKKIKALNSEVEAIKKDRLQWLEYKQQKKQIKQAWEQRKSKQPMKLPPPPTSILQQQASPTQYE
ncbi:hypothetical protein L6452_02367 [Arctium lappa]|uniref:Uncharacterized protein n=1 Tax=Arctium lappa TaxID=4217 RepID=A0ACB9FJV2_ARCLA|nr:hypothetical protein L6452_02367 [Arctium lappa]